MNINLKRVSFFVMGLSAAAVLHAMDDVTRIRLEKGRTTGVLRARLAPAEHQRYYLEARAGQNLSAHMLSAGDKVMFQIYGPKDTCFPDGRPLAFAGDRAGVMDFNGKLPVAAEYQIAVWAVDGKSTDFVFEIHLPAVNAPTEKSWRERVKACAAQESGSRVHVTGSERLTIGLPGDIFPEKGLKFDGSGASAAYVSRADCADAMKAEAVGNNCWKSVYEFVGNGTVSVLAPSAVQGVPDYKLEVRVGGQR